VNALPPLALFASVLWIAAFALPGTGLAQGATTQGDGTPGAAVAGAVVVSDLRIGVHPEMTRVVLDLSAPVLFQVETQADPFRVVVDLPATDWRSRSRPRSTGLVQAWRHGAPSPDSTRLVLDASGPVRVRQAFVLPPGGTSLARLVLDIEGTTQAAFAAEIGRPHGTRVLDRGIKPWQPAEGAAVAAIAASPPEPAPIREMPAPAAASLAKPAPVPAPLRPVAPTNHVQTAGMPPLAVPPVPVDRSPAIEAAVRVPAPPAVRPRAVRGKPVIAIDPGHGGIDPGAISVAGVYEKAITLQVARALRDQIQATGRYRVVLTRDGDEFVRLRDRVALARAEGADLFVSLHADSLGQANVSGMSIYTLSDTASDREAEMLAARENRADALGGLDLVAESDEVVGILIDLAQRDTMNQSRRVANLLVEEMGRQIRLLPRPHRSAGFAVLTAPDVPSVLIELGYLSNPRDAKLLTQSEHQIRLARSIVRGIDGYFAAASGLSRS
jgi:N-acetylmuramoyl-L-alanine amidase